MKLVMRKSPSAPRATAKALNITAKKADILRETDISLLGVSDILQAWRTQRRMMKNTRYGNRRIYLSYLKNGSLP